MYIFSRNLLYYYNNLITKSENWQNHMFCKIASNKNIPRIKFIKKLSPMNVVSTVNVSIFASIYSITCDMSLFCLQASLAQMLTWVLTAQLCNPRFQGVKYSYILFVICIVYCRYQYRRQSILG